MAKNLLQDLVVKCSFRKKRVHIREHSCSGGAEVGDHRGVTPIFPETYDSFLLNAGVQIITSRQWRCHPSLTGGMGMPRPKLLRNLVATPISKTC